MGNKGGGAVWGVGQWRQTYGERCFGKARAAWMGLVHGNTTIFEASAVVEACRVLQVALSTKKESIDLVLALDHASGLGGRAYLCSAWYYRGCRMMGIR